MKMPPKLPSGGRTLVYSAIDGHDLHLDYYVPIAANGPIPLVVYYHGGGMTAGSRRDFQFPHWLFEHCQEKGYLFVSADYRLCHPCTALDQIQDAQALFKFLVGPRMAQSLPLTISVQPASIAVAGWSAGAFSARAACIYAEPKPAVLLSVFGSGGDWLLKYLTTPRPPTSIARSVDLSQVPTLLEDERIISDDTGEGAWFTDRFALAVQWELNGTLLDNWLGCQGISAQLNDVQDSERAMVIPDSVRPAFTQLFVTKDHPPSVLIHGTADDVVAPEESKHHHEQLKSLGVKTSLLLVEDGPHGLVSFSVDSGPKPCDGAAEAYKRSLEFIDEVFETSP